MTRVLTYHTLPTEALRIRFSVFVDEQGFADEVDEIDDIATHLVLFEDDTPVGTCRLFPGENDTVYILGRLAVLKTHRGKGYGRRLLAAAEEHLRSLGAASLTLHSQCRAQAFYEACGYTACSDVEEEQGCPHIWMKKPL